MDNNLNNPLNQSTTPVNNDASTPIADNLQKANATSAKKKNAGLIVALSLVAAFFGVFVISTAVTNFTSVKIPLLSKIVPHFNFNKKTEKADSTSIPQADASVALTLDTAVTAADTMSKEQLANDTTHATEKIVNAKPAEKIIEEKPVFETKKIEAVAKKTTTHKPAKQATENVVATETKTETKVASVKKQEPTKPVEPASTSNEPTKTTSEKVAKSSEIASTTTVSIADEKKNAKEKTEAYKSEKKKKEPTVNECAVYNSSNSYYIPAGSKTANSKTNSSASAYPTYAYKTNPNEKKVAASSGYSGYTSYPMNEAKFIKASKPYPTSLDGYLKSIGNAEIDYDSRFAFSERCLQTYFVPGAQAQLVDENGRVMSTTNIEDLLGVMRVNEFSVLLKNKQMSGSRIAAIQYTYKF